MSDQKTCPTCGTEYPLSERFCPRDGTALRSSNTQDLLGSVVADRYHILKKLGEGGMGTVYLAEHVKMGRKSALKVMNPGMNTDPDAIARFNREASNASRLSHPNICGIYDFGETPEGLIYLAMEFIEGTSLTALIEKDGSLPAARAASIVHQTADALQVAHDAGIVHRDLKPDNIMITKNRDGSDLVKVVDFGIAKASSSDAQKVTKTGLVVGTPEYMSPEQLAGDKLDGRSDIYSLALVAFNTLTGQLPFPANTAQEAMIMRLTDRPRTLAEMSPEKAWPEALQAAMDKALARDAGDRYTGAAQFGREFQAAIADMPMTQAIEAKTSVIGAVNAGGAAPGAVPQTRVAPTRPSAKTMPMEAPAAARKAAVAAPVKKSVMPMVLGGAGGLAVVAFAVFKFGGFGGGAPPANGSPSDTTTRTDTSGRQLAGAPPVDTSGASKAVELGKKGVPVPTPGKTTTPNTTPTGGTPNNTPSITTQLEQWQTALESDMENKVLARRILGDLETLKPSATGRTLGEWHYVEMWANMVIGSTDACRAADDVLRLSTDPSRRTVATRTKADDLCKP